MSSLMLKAEFSDPVLPGINPLASFVNELQSIRQFELAPPTWSTALLSSLVVARRAEDDIVVVDKIISELLYPNLSVIPQGSSDHSAGMTALLLVLTNQRGDSPLLDTIIRHHLPYLLEGHGIPLILNNPQPLVWTLRQSLILFGDTSPDSASRLVSELVDEIKYQRARPLKDARETEGAVKRPAMARGSARTIGSAEKRFLDMLIKTFDDVELKARWPALSQL